MAVPSTMTVLVTAVAPAGAAGQAIGAGTVTAAGARHAAALRARRR
ncbi:hypothetical protein FHS43_003516 [Streptosporangium becharense]|uniref:Uncharacterized protein n=1 Tax=Streptosporangium becharense TaxID=1816182 RepID=A0A7W9IET6_9ACTN|nr:hypothetical protein [Streptosporangium becharense]MBB2912236.1 hypothetical protein [Streptosporangium becharense]MBB5818783.1 hypothetical protein [Streptosporangium becharense]